MGLPWPLLPAPAWPRYKSWLYMSSHMVGLSQGYTLHTLCLLVRYTYNQSAEKTIRKNMQEELKSYLCKYTKYLEVPFPSWWHLRAFPADSSSSTMVCWNTSWREAFGMGQKSCATYLVRQTTFFVVTWWNFKWIIPRHIVTKGKKHGLLTQIGRT